MPTPPDPNDPFASIDPAALAQVSGGATASQYNDSNSVDVLGALSGILESLNDLSSNRSSSGFSTTEMLMLMYVMEQRNRGPTVVAAPPPMPYYVVRR